MVNIGLMFRRHGDRESTGVLFVKVISARLPDCVDSLVSLQFLPHKDTRTYTQETAIQKKKFNPTWNQVFQFDNVSMADLKKSNALQVNVVDCVGEEDLVRGFLRLGMTLKSKQKSSSRIDSVEEVSSHWQRMLENQGKEIKMWHSLKDSTNADVHSNIKTKRNDIHQDKKKVTILVGLTKYQVIFL